MKALLTSAVVATAILVPVPAVAGTTWTASQPIPGACGGMPNDFGYSLDATADAQKAFAVWNCGAAFNGYGTMQYSFFSGASWSTPSTLPGDPQGEFIEVALAADGSRAVAVWMEQVGALDAARAAFWTPSGGWSAVAQLTSGTPVVAAMDLSASITDDGRTALVGWSEERAAGGSIRIGKARFWSQDTGWQATHEFGTTDGYALSTDLSGNGSTALAAWYDASDRRIMGSRWRQGAWGNNYGLSISNASLEDPQVAVADDGSAGILTWFWSAAGTPANKHQMAMVWKLATASDQGWPAGSGTDLGVNARSISPASVAMTRDGSAGIVAYETDTGSTTGIAASRYDLGSWSSLPQTSNGTLAQTPLVAMSDNGQRGASAFESNDGNQVWARALDGSAWSAAADFGGARGPRSLSISAAGTRGWIGFYRPGASDNVGFARFTTTAPPQPPTAVTAAAGDASAAVSWTAADDNNSPVTQYIATVSPGGQTCSTSGAVACVISGLTNGTTYTASVVARNAEGFSPASTPSATFTPSSPGAGGGGSGGSGGGTGGGATPASVPSSVLGLKVKVKRTKATVTWAPVASATGYQTKLGKGAWKSAAMNRAVFKVKKGKKYRVSVRAVNAAGPGPATVKSFKAKG